MALEKQIIQIASYRLTAPAEDFTSAITALSRQTQAGGPGGILRYSFYVNPEEQTAGSVIVFRDPESWIEQHKFVGSLVEYQNFYNTIELAGLRFLGNLTSEILDWLHARQLQFKYDGQLAAGFER